MKPGSCWLKHQLGCHARQRFRCPSQLKQIRVAFWSDSEVIKDVMAHVLCDDGTKKDIT